MFDLAARRQLNRGYSDGLSRAVEIVVTPLLFGYAGHLIDGWLGIRPAMTIVLAAVAVAGLFVKLWLGYDREMRKHEADAVWARRSSTVDGASTAPSDAVDADAAARAAGIESGPSMGGAGGGGAPA